MLWSAGSLSGLAMDSDPPRVITPPVAQSATSLDALLRQTRQLRLEGKFEESYTAACSFAGATPRIGSLAWEHHKLFWSDITARNCILSRRGPADLAFLRKAWQDEGFMRQFHRQAPKLPIADQRLTEILKREFVALLRESHALHWIVRDREGRPHGLLSLVDLSLQHRKAEVLLGVLPGAPFGLATSAMLMLFQFYFRVLRFHKLYSLVYPDNPRSLAGTLHLGFRIEGELKEEVFDPHTGRPSDLIRTGLLASDALSPKNDRLMKRLLGVPGVSVSKA